MNNFLNTLFGISEIDGWMVMVCLLIAFGFFLVGKTGFFTNKGDVIQNLIYLCVGLVLLITGILQRIIQKGQAYAEDFRLKALSEHRDNFNQKISNHVESGKAAVTKMKTQFSKNPQKKEAPPSNHEETLIQDEQ